MNQFKGIDILATHVTKLNSIINTTKYILLDFDEGRKDSENNGRKGGGVCIYILTQQSNFLTSVQVILNALIFPRNKSPGLFLFINSWTKDEFGCLGTPQYDHCVS